MGTIRVLTKASIYFVLIIVAIALLPFLAAYAFGTNWRNIADRLSSLPGVTQNGGVQTALVGFGYAGILWVFLFGVGASSGGETKSETPTQATPTTTPRAHTPTTNAPEITTTPPSDQTVTATPIPREPSTPTPISTPDRPGIRVQVVDVVDGDTIDIRYQNGTSDTVRLLGVDTPEVYGETNPAEFEGVPNNAAGENCLSVEAEDASNYAQRRLAGTTVRLKFDSLSDRRGYYGRLLAYVIVDGQNFNHQLVAEGYARVYDSQFEQSERFYAAENDAQASDIGVWRCQNIETETTTPTDGEGKLVVETVHADAEGNDHENLNGEYIVFKNTGGSPLRISGWTVEDEAGHTYTVPSGVEIEAGETITLYTGSGDNTDNSLYWKSDSAIWNNSGDTVIVTTERGKTTVRHGYS